MATSKKKSISVVVAIYKNELSINPFLVRLEKVINQVKSKYDVELILVNDGTPDKSILEIDSFRKKGTSLKIRIVTLSRNFGQLNAILAGISTSDSDAVINISADLQDPPELIIKILQKYDEGHQVVIAARANRKDGLLHQLTSSTGYYFLGRGALKVPKGGFDYFLLDREPVKHLLALKGRFRFIQGDILSLGFDPFILKYTREKRIYGNSAYTFVRRLQVFIDSFIDISFGPIKFLTRFGFLTAIIGFIFALLALLSFIDGSSPFNGFTALFVTLLIFGGLQLMAIGLIGEYIFRIYDMNRGRPAFIVKKSR